MSYKVLRYGIEFNKAAVVSTTERRLIVTKPSILDGDALSKLT